MLNKVKDFFEITPNYNLDIMKANQSFNELISLILTKMGAVLFDSSPDLRLLDGDTTTSRLNAFAAFNVGIKSGHVEMGLRTIDK
jgi:UDP-N-acetylglucosamine 2-epimerase (non-hydrolysing)